MPKDPDMEWLRQNSPRYAGYWVALKDGQLLAVARTFLGLVEVIGNPRGRGILVTRIPKRKETQMSNLEDLAAMRRKCAAYTILEGMLQRSKEAAGLSDEELADALIVDVWAEFSLDSRSSALVDEAATRLAPGVFPDDGLEEIRAKARTKKGDKS